MDRSGLPELTWVSSPLFDRHVRAGKSWTSTMSLEAPPEIRHRIYQVAFQLPECIVSEEFERDHPHLSFGTRFRKPIRFVSHLGPSYIRRGCYGGFHQVSHGLVWLKNRGLPRTFEPLRTRPWDNKSHPARQTHTYPLERDSGSPFDLSFLLVSKTIYMEAYPVFYRISTLYFKNTDRSPFDLSVLPCPRQSIWRHVRLLFPRQACGSICGLLQAHLHTHSFSQEHRHIRFFTASIRFTSRTQASYSFS